MKWFHAHKYLVLLAIVIIALMLEPRVRGIGMGVAYVIVLAVFMTVFQHRRNRITGLMLGLPTLAAEAACHVVSGTDRLLPLVAYHALIAVFLAFAVVTVLRDIFENQRIGFDHLLGAFCGFVLLGIAWGNLYLLNELVAPGSFRIRPEIAAELQHEETRRFLFNYLSFMTLTAGGFEDLVPVATTARNLTWLEAMFGQFYVAVYIGQLMALKATPSVSA